MTRLTNRTISDPQDYFICVRFRDWTLWTRDKLDIISLHGYEKNPSWARHNFLASRRRRRENILYIIEHRRTEYGQMAIINHFLGLKTWSRCRGSSGREFKPSSICIKCQICTQNSILKNEQHQEFYCKLTEVGFASSKFKP